MEVFMSYQHSESDILFICDPNNTIDNIVEKFGCGQATVSRWRKRYNADIPTGCRKGVKKPWQKNGNDVKCKICDKLFYKTKSSESIYCCRSCMYSDTDFIEKLRNVDRSYMQTEEFRNKFRKENTEEWVRYKNRVYKLTEKVYNEHIDIINPNRHPRTIAGVDGGWQLDHIIEVRYGFDNQIPPEILCEVSNLRMLPWKKNLERNRKKTPSKV